MLNSGLGLVSAISRARSNLGMIAASTWATRVDGAAALAAEEYAVAIGALIQCIFIGLTSKGSDGLGVRLDYVLAPKFQVKFLANTHGNQFICGHFYR
jgi:hypothetical protein